MKMLGLMRHFRVPHRKNQWMDSRGFAEWSLWYDRFDVTIPSGLSPLREWDVCFSSDLPRANKTAHAYFMGEVERWPSLREVPFAPLFKTKRLLPLVGWQVMSRMGWKWAHPSQEESRKQTLQRIELLLDELEAKHSDKKVLLVTHGFLMQFMQRSLRRRGYLGRVPLRPIWGQVYSFQPK